MARDGDNDCAVTFCLSKVGVRHASGLFTIRGELKDLPCHLTPSACKEAEGSLHKLAKECYETDRHGGSKLELVRPNTCMTVCVSTQQLGRSFGGISPEGRIDALSSLEVVF